MPKIMKTRLQLMLLSSLGSAVLAAVPALCENVPTFRGNPEHSGIYDAAGVPALNGVKWTFKAAGRLIASPTVDGPTVYIGSTVGLFYAVDRESGSLKWKFPAKARIASTAALAAGIVYFGAYDGNLYALDAASGTLKWKFATQGEHRYAATHLHGSQPLKEVMPDPFDCYLSSPVVWNGTVYFGSGDGNIYALDAASGALKWKFKTGDVVHASPAYSDGVLFVGSWDSYFYAVDVGNGKEKWRYHAGEDPLVHNQVGFQSSPAVVDGVVYTGCRDAQLYALDAATGKAKWKFDNALSWVITSPAVVDGKVYFATSDSSLYHVVEAGTGKPILKLEDKAFMFSSPAVTNDVVFIGVLNGTLEARDRNSGELLWEFQTETSKQNANWILTAERRFNVPLLFFDNWREAPLVSADRQFAIGAIFSSPLVANGCVYFGSTDGFLYALE